MKTLDDVSEFHGHVCPGLAIGYRVARFAMGKLGPKAEDEELVAVVENDSCAVDAVQVLTGCTFGKGNLIHRDYGKQVYTFMKRPSGEALRVSVEWVTPEETEEEKEAWERYMKGDRSEDVLTVVHRRKSRKIEAIMNASDEDLFAVSWPEVELPPEARIYRSVRCELCGEKVMEPRARLREGKTVCIPCFDKAD
ncbi:MAG: FmdE family protein [Nitrospirota bacterium]|jgi:formylmethanofuran dehydrogenase subunit E